MCHNCTTVSPVDQLQAKKTLQCKGMKNGRQTRKRNKAPQVSLKTTKTQSH